MATAVLFTPAEVAQRLGVTPETVRYWDQTGKLRAIRTPSGRRLFTQEQIEALEEHRRERHRQEAAARR